MAESNEGKVPTEPKLPDSSGWWWYLRFNEWQPVLVFEGSQPVKESLTCEIAGTCYSVNSFLNWGPPCSMNDALLRQRIQARIREMEKGHGLCILHSGWQPHIKNAECSGWEPNRYIAIAELRRLLEAE